MTIEKFIEIAIQGEWANGTNIVLDPKYGLIQKLASNGFTLLDRTIVFLNPEAWKAIEKYLEDRMEESNSKQHTFVTYDRWGWEEKMKGMIPFLIGGGDLEEYIATL